MKSLSIALGILIALGLATKARAADAAMGKAKAEAVCAACHGANGISVADKFPNLAGQKAKYLQGQLKAFKSGKRKNLIMNPIASQLDDKEIGNLAAFFSGLPGGSGTAKSKVPDHIVKTHVGFPADYKKTYTYYTTINFPKRGQVRRYYANPAAMKAAREGKPLPNGAKLFVEIFKVKLDANKMAVKDSDGFLVGDKLLAYTAMEKQPGWGKAIPEMLRNGDWNYAVFKGDKTLKPGVNQATCFACHKPHADKSYVFSLKALQDVARK